MSHTFRRVAIVFAISVLVLVAAFASSELTQAVGQAGSPKMYAVVNGSQVELSPQAVIARGSLRADGRCDIPRFRLVSEFSRELNQSDIDVMVTGDCALQVVKADLLQGVAPRPDLNFEGYESSQVEPSEVSPTNRTAKSLPSRLLELSGSILPIAGAEASHGTHLRGWAKAESNDAFEIDVTVAEAHVSYYDYVSGVHGGHDPFNECRWFFHWELENCAAFWWPDGPNLVYNETSGAFTQPECPEGGCYHSLLARYEGWPNFNGIGVCDFNPDDPPPGLHYHCQGGWYTLN